MNEPLNTGTVRQFSLEELYPVIREQLDAGGDVKMTITGTSMVPTLKGGRDRVTFRRPEAPVRKGDLILYRRDSGQFVLHRIVSLPKDGTCTCCGDHQWVREPGIRQDQIVGLVTEITRKGKSFPISKLAYRLWVRVWVFLLPCRRALIRVYHAFQ